MILKPETACPTIALTNRRARFEGGRLVQRVVASRGFVEHGL
jgi:hypothetical protein